ncbi:MAG: ferric reductase-like transmembrane domain-containing protein [Chloroflexi bacterium]|nr:ferric reductase-like transmembrane domain-containing protein [Chloroflexota bacterium]
MTHEFWYMSRAAGFTAYGLLFVSTALGIVIGTRLMGRLARNTTYDIHRFASILALVFTTFHVFILLGDAYFHYSIWQLLVPFLSPYRGWQTAAGVFGLYLLIIVVASFWIRRFIGYRAWRGLHFAAFALFGLATLHGVTAGTDTSAAWGRAVYLGAGGVTLALIAYRIQYHMPETQAARTVRAFAGMATAVAAAWFFFGAGLFTPSGDSPVAQVSQAASAPAGSHAILTTFGGQFTGRYSESSGGNTARLVLDASTSGDLPVTVHIELLQLVSRGDDDGDHEEEEHEEHERDDEDEDEHEHEGDEEEEHEGERRTTIARNVAQLLDPASGELLCDGVLTALDQGYLEMSCNGRGPYDGIVISISSDAQVNDDGTLSGTLNGTMVPQG